MHCMCSTLRVPAAGHSFYPSPIHYVIQCWKILVISRVRGIFSKGFSCNKFVLNVCVMGTFLRQSGCLSLPSGAIIAFTESAWKKHCTESWSHLILIQCQSIEKCSFTSTSWGKYGLYHCSLVQLGEKHPVKSRTGLDVPAEWKHLTLYFAYWTCCDEIRPTCSAAAHTHEPEVFRILTDRLSLSLCPVHSAPPGSRIQPCADSSAVTTARSWCSRQGQGVRTDKPVIWRRECVPGC